MDGAMLLPKQLQRHSWPTQLAVDRRPLRLRPTIPGRNRRRRVEPALQLPGDDVASLQAAADRLSPEIIRKRLDYWTLILGPKFSAKERKQLNLSRFYAISQIEYCRNFIFRRNFPIHKLLERSCELGLWRLTANKIAAIFGSRLYRRHRGKLATVIDQIEHGRHGPAA
jgi:hypothetical protein